MIGFSDGRQYESEWDMVVGNNLAIPLPTPTKERTSDAPTGSEGPSKVAGDYTPLTDEEHKALMWDTPVVKGADPELNEGTPQEFHQRMDEMLNRTQEDINKQYKESDKAFPNQPPSNPPPAGRVRGWKDIPAFQEYLKNLPDDIDAHDMKDGTVVFRKRPALTSDSGEYKVAMMDNPYETPKQSMIDAPGGFGGGGGFSWSRIGNTKATKGSVPEAANMNKESKQIDPTPYEEEMLNQSWNKLGKDLGGSSADKMRDLVDSHESAFRMGREDTFYPSEARSKNPFEPDSPRGKRWQEGRDQAKEELRATKGLTPAEEKAIKDILGEDK